MKLIIYLFSLQLTFQYVVGFTSLIGRNNNNNNQLLSVQQSQHQQQLWSTAESSTTSSDTITKLDGRKINGIIQPLNNFILVQIADAIESTDGGILLTGKAKIKKTEGVVISVGPGRIHSDSGILIPMPVSIGDQVIYGKYDGTEININNKIHTLISDNDVLIKFPATEKCTLDNVEVIYDNILVYIEKNEEETEGGILLAKSSKQNDKKQSIGKVIKVGPGKLASNNQLISMDININDMIKFRDYAINNEIDIDNVDYSIIRMEDILAKY